MRCPKCESTNLYKATSKRYLCKDCKKSSKPEELLPDLANSVTSPADKKLALKFDISTLKDRLGQLRKLSPKQYIPIGIASLLGIGGIVYFVTRDPYVCSTRQIEKTLTGLEPLMKDWSNANKLAESTSRSDLTMPVSKLQDIRKAVENLETPDCSKPFIAYFSEMADNNIDSYLQFMQDGNDSVLVQDMVAESVASQKVFEELVYPTFRRGERLDIEKIEIEKQLWLLRLKRQREGM